MTRTQNATPEPLLASTWDIGSARMVDQSIATSRG
jgi:hypothetical protein